MADAAKSDEIEDVLSSIRRLVSEHQPPDSVRTPEPREEAPAVVPEAQGEKYAPNEKLILTPALRVTDPEDPWVPITPRAVDETVDETGVTPEDDGQGPKPAEGDDWAEGLLAGSQDEAGSDDPAHMPDPQLQADQWDASGSDAVTDPDLGDDDLQFDPCGQPSGLAESAGNAAEDGTPGDDEPETEAPDEVPLSFIRSTSSVRDYEPEEGDNGFCASTLPAAMRDLAQSRAAQEHPVQAAPDDPAPEATERDAARVRVEIVKAVIAEELHGAADGAEDDEAEMPADAADAKDASGPSDTAAEQGGLDGLHPGPSDDGPRHYRDAADNVTDFLAAAPGERDEEPYPETGVEDLGEGPFIFPDDGDTFVDEEALRELIAEVVREELQGEMGVRITRNIRKLVRREIRLALAAQELE
ncbi:hypothetical protein DZD18_15630 [Rhodobacteraceae bacterium W635]|uniref:hypothetical protein n=1 Tax=Nioella halotolerans TaxID=2303578 RepID=UPI000E3D197A|nr:hypothetical protein DZD18_15630 [Rhodobacteraceae bacterium W635]